MKLAAMAGYWASGPPADAGELFTAADRLGFDQVWGLARWPTVWA
jgi:hypothetical protein